MQMLRRQWIEDRDGFLMVYSIIDKTSFDDLNNFYELIEQVKEDQLDKGVPLVLVANKADLIEVCARSSSTQRASRCTVLALPTDLLSSCRAIGSNSNVKSQKNKEKHEHKNGTQPTLKHLQRLVQMSHWLSKS
jgi:hypothetical protein